jgi:isoquinoline 1-oxidoreductase beta subunit
MNKHTKAFEVELSRRQIMVGAAGLSFTFVAGRAASAAVLAAEPAGQVQVMNPWISISADGTITIMSAATEMGQGSLTALPLIIAEELDADWAKVRITPAPPLDQIYGNPVFGGMMYTAGSAAVTSYYKSLRMIGAQVRRVLLDNAARKLGVSVDELTTEPSLVVHAKSGRKLSYGDIAAFAEVPKEAPAMTPEDLKKSSAFRLISKDVMRVELPTKVNGSAKYGIDMQLPGMLYGTVVRAPVEGAIPSSFDEHGVKAIKGVVQTVMLPYGVAAIADTPWAAFAAQQIVADSVRWSKDGVAWGFDSDKGLEAFTAAVRDPDRQATDFFKLGDAKTEMSRAASTIDQVYLCDYAYHAQMEPLNALASVSPAGDSAEIWCGTQSQTMAQEATAKALGITRDKVKLNDLLMGGGFGRRGSRDMDYLIDAVLLSKAARAPVKVVWTREDDIRNGRFRPLSAHHLKAGLDASGVPIAYQHRLAGDKVTPFADPVRYQKAGKKDFILMLGADLKGYDVPNQLVEQIFEDTGMRTSPLRGIGFTANKFAAETFLDEIAVKNGVDPLKFRLQLLGKTPRAVAVVERVAAMANWGRKVEGRGFGMAFVDYSGSQVAGIVEVSLDRETGKIKVHNFWCTIDCGVAVQPDNIIAQTEGSAIYGLGLALSERISIKDGAVEQSNFYDYLVPRLNEVPQFHTEIVQTDNHPTGVGQMSTPLVAPAISNAVMQLTGVRLRHAPFTPERVKAAIG